MTSITPRAFITSVLRVLGVVAAGATADTDEVTDGLESANELIDAWATNDLTIPSASRELFTLTAYQGSYTIGSGGTFNTTRPLSIDAASILVNNADVLSVTSITRASTTATVTVPAHGYVTGMAIVIAGAVQTAYNGTKTITVTGTNTFTFSVSGSPVTPATGTITAQDSVGEAFEIPLDPQTYDQYVASPIKGLSSTYPSQFYYNPTVASGLGTIILWPIPNQTLSLILYLQTVLAQFDAGALDTSVLLAPGYARALRYNVALELLPEYPRPDDSAVARITKTAQTSLADIKRKNDTPSILDAGELGALFGQGPLYNIYSDS